MQKNLRSLLKELLWLVLSLILAVIITTFAFQIFLGNTALDIHLHDTYFVLPFWTSVIPLFLFITFLTFFFKELRHKFSKTRGNIIIIVSGLAIVITLTIATRLLVKIDVTFASGCTAYPPLSALPPTNINLEPRTNPFFDTIANWLTALQFVIIGSLLFVAYLWGTKKHNS